MFLTEVVYQAQTRLLIITPIAVIPDVSLDPLAVCLQVMNKQMTSLLQDRCFGCCFSALF